ncbi:MAG TPA: glycoside hydrolase family 3 C-terminal domain-containing protein [Chitinophagaceae bacterium]|nr:glycoside hydrolase family 3 C-terminal domain-containing protein [Chitinophagaceae bacterium]
MKVSDFRIALCAAITVILFSAKLHAQTEAPQLGKSSVKDVVNAMTLEEKARLVVGMGFHFQSPVPRRDTGAAARRPQMPATDPADDIPEKVPGAAGRTHAIPRLGIPSITVSDGPAGIRISPIRNNDSSKTYYATAWPSGTLLASSWDTLLVKKVGAAFGNEIKEYGADIILGPALNIHRNPLGGRNFEYYSEDPLIAGDIAAAMVNGIQSQGVGTSIKHFVANNQETNRNSINTIVSERALREIYLKGFEITVKKAQPWTVMTSYNKLNGPYTSENPELVTTILRNEWGFKGLVMTDWFGGSDPVAQMNAGNDLLMPGTADQTKKIIDAVNDGKLDVKKLDENVEHILNIILKTPEFKKYSYSNKPDLKDHAVLSRLAAADGMVLLKNDGKTLPLKPGKKIALFGNTSYDIIAGGTGSGDVNKPYTINLAQGLASGGYSVDAPMQSEYEQHIAEAKAKRPKPRGFSFGLPAPIPELIIDAARKAGDNDAAIITIGRNAGEGADRKLENDFYLSDTEKAIIKNISDAFHAQNKKVIVVLNIGGVIETDSWADEVDAILLAWQPGLEAGNAITDVLSGKVDPSGKLATTFPVKYEDVPSAKNFPGKELPLPAGQQAPSRMRGRPAEVTYEEGIYVGYRYYNTFHVKPSYPFGYGLSYTAFSYGPLTVNASPVDGKFTATVTIVIKNTGIIPGKEVVELYIGAPGKKMDKPDAELKGFAKTRLLRPGESEKITFNIDAADLASFDTKASAWVTEAGKYTVEAGASSADIRQTATFNIGRDIITEKVNKVLVPQVSIDEYKPPTQ